jgi:HNH endonuclease
MQNDGHQAGGAPLCAKTNRAKPLRAKETCTKTPRAKSSSAKTQRVGVRRRARRKNPAAPRKRPRIAWRQHGFTGASLAERLRSRIVVDPETGCHNWTGTVGRAGYGRVQVSAHRLAYELAHGPIPDGLLVLHKCDNPVCCNPDHLFLGTSADNMADKVRKGRHRNGSTGKLNKPREPGGS